MTQIARNLTDGEDGALTGVCYLIHDPDPLFTRAFCDVLRSPDMQPVKLPARSPNLNPCAERFVRTIKSEGLSHIIPLGERHLRNTVNEFTPLYHLEYNHQRLNHRPNENTHDEHDVKAAISRHERLRDRLKYYHRLAA
jgi:hypothetical protein